MRYVLWREIFKSNLRLESPYLIIQAVLAVMIVFVACAIIDYVRIELLEKPIRPYVERIGNTVAARLKIG
jgi:hypothetical protein